MRPLCFAALISTSLLAVALHIGPYTELQGLQQRSNLFGFHVHKLKAGSPLQQLKVQADDIDPIALYPSYNLSVPIDHFPNNDKYAPHSKETFPLRYWFDATYYQLGGPVILLASGETSGENRLSFLQKGILHQLIKETRGIGVILEHRYYGMSMPTRDLSPKSMRFLDTQQALADYAYFATHIRFPGLEDKLLNSDWTSWIVYGGSYAGSFAAFLRTLYPSVFWGAVSSSGVPAAIVDYWQYWEAVRLYAPENCVSTTQDIMQVVDGIMLKSKKKKKLVKKLKRVFGLSHVHDDADFASAISMAGVGRWQGKVWDPAIGDPTFAYYCGNVTNKEVLHASQSRPSKRLKKLKHQVRKLVKKEGSLEPTTKLITSIINFIGFVNQDVVQTCRKGKLSQDQCLGTNNKRFWRQEDLGQWPWRSWTWQYCTQWGYFQTGSGIPSHIRPVVSRGLTMDYMTRPCRLAFGLKTPVVPDVDSVNQYGAFNISYPRLAFIDGQADPWRWAGVHAPGAVARKDWITQPFVQIKDAVHHWDEYGLFRNETHKGSVPVQVARAQEYERAFVKMWVDEYRWKCRWQGKCDVSSQEQQVLEDHDRL